MVHSFLYGVCTLQWFSAIQTSQRCIQQWSDARVVPGLTAISHQTFPCKIQKVKFMKAQPILVMIFVL